MKDTFLFILPFEIKANDIAVRHGLKIKAGKIINESKKLTR